MGGQVEVDPGFGLRWLARPPGPGPSVALDVLMR